VTNSDTVIVSEGGTGTFTVMLNEQPESAVNATVGAADGDGDISVREGGSLTFNPSNWDFPQTVTLAAAEDPDTANGSATIRISAAGLPDKDVIATESDNDLISVTSPNGGEQWLQGTAHEITWISIGGLETTVTIELYRSGLLDSTIVSGAPHSGSYSWAIPPDQEAGSDYRVRVSFSPDSSIGDFSDNDFTVVATELDEDSDGVPDTLESGPDGTDPSHDGNGDGIPDSQQGNVASLPSSDGTHYVTLESSGGLRNLRALAPSPGAPPDVTFPYGLYEFTVTGISALGIATLTFYLDGEVPNTFYKFGPTPGNQDPDWYEFLFDPLTNTGALINGAIVTLEFIDGERGDDDLAFNGTVVDQGGPAVTAAGNGGGGGDAEVRGKDCFIATAVFGSYEAPYVRILREFRDRFLLTHKAGRFLVEMYYRSSPPLAKWLKKHDSARTAVRILLTPVIVFSWVLLTAGFPVLPVALLLFTGSLLFLLPRSEGRGPPRNI
jgi:hypothetical protein